jgi:hypothetical protein
MFYGALVLFFLLTILVEVEWFGWALFELFVLGVCLTIAHKFKLFTFPYVKLNDIVVYAAAYMCIGIVWSLLKWIAYLFKFRNDLRDEIRTWKISHNHPLNIDLNDENKKRAWEWLPVRLRRRPVASEHQGSIIGWIAFWPCSVIGFVLNDPVRRFFAFIFNLLKNSYQRIANHVVNESDFK